MKMSVRKLPSGKVRTVLTGPDGREYVGYFKESDVESKVNDFVKLLGVKEPEIRKGE